MDLKEAALLGGDQESHWYYIAKSRALLQALDNYQPGHILDVGAGSGFFSRSLLRHTCATRATCVDPGYARDWSEIHFGKPIAFRRQRPAGDENLVLLMDVLEHVDDDVGLVREIAAAAPPGTRFIASAPAFPWLWSGHDEFLEHRRRYRLPGLAHTLSAAGLRPVAGFYFFAAIFPAAAVQRMWSRLASSSSVPRSDLRPHHPWTNAILTWVCSAECAVAPHNRAFGLTAFAVAAKA